MIPGWCTAHLSSGTRTGIPYPGFFGAASALASVLGLASATSEDLDGAGATGDMTGTDVVLSLTITPSSPIAKTSVTRGSITVISHTVTSALVVSITAADSMVLRVFAAARALAEVPAFTLNQGHAPARLVALIMVEMSEAFRPAASRVLEAAPTVVAGIGEGVFPPVKGFRNSINGEKHHAADNFDSSTT